MVTKKLQSEQTKFKILEAAFKLLKESGVNSLTANGITKAAKISKGGFFHHFPQIEDFYLFMFDSIIISMGDEMLNTKFKDIESLLNNSMELTFDMIDESPEIFTVIFYFFDLSRFNPNYSERLKQVIEKSIDKWTNDLSEYFPADFSDERKKVFAYMIDIFFAGLGTHYLSLKNKEHYKKISKEFIRMLSNTIQG